MIGSILSLLFWTQVSAATLPQANFTVTPPTAEVGKELTFDASDSKNTRGTREGLEYRFQFANERAWTPWSASTVQKFKPADIGNYRARLEVRERQTGTVSTTYRTYKITGETFRKIHIEVTPTRLRAGEPAYFELVATLPRTEDQDGIQVRWDFNSDGVWETQMSRQRIVEHIFSREEVGQVSPTAEVRFVDGTLQRVRGIENIPVNRAGYNRPVLKQFWPKLQIFPAAVVPPIVDVSPGKQGYTEETVFRFDASRSRISPNAWLEWNFYGEQFAKGKSVVSHKFDDPGLHEVYVRTCYDRANPKCAETLVTVNVKANPTDYRAEIQAQNMTRQSSFSVLTQNQFFTAVAGDRIRFSAVIRNLGMTGGIFSYRWDFEGDGVFDTPFQVSTSAEYLYPRAGNFTPTVQVQNEDLISVSSSVKLHVVSNTAPHGSFTVDRARIYVGDKVKFFPKVADEQDIASRLFIRFDADGDGAWDSDFRYLTSHEWRYEEPGQYVAYMQVKDENGRISTIARTVTVFGYEKPQARVTVSSSTGTTQTLFTFDASRSIGKNLQYVWDMDYKGPQDLISEGQNAFTSQKVLQKRFPAPGEKVIGLTVRDGYGNADSVHFMVRVSQYALSPTPIFPEANPKTDNLYPGGGVPMDSSVPGRPLPPGTKDSNVPAKLPREAQVDPLTTSLREFYLNGGEFSQKKTNTSALSIFEPERELVRADMFFFLYEKELQIPRPELQEVEPLFWTAQYGMDHNIPPFLMANPFSDVKENDWFYQAALFSYRDKYSTAPFFFPAQKVTAEEAESMVKKFTNKTVDFGEMVTRGEFRGAVN